MTASKRMSPVVIGLAAAAVLVLLGAIWLMVSAMSDAVTESRVPSISAEAEARIIAICKGAADDAKEYGDCVSALTKIELAK